eukprot:jgi/Botrbrau1/17827/Bobra.0127s0072.2
MGCCFAHVGHVGPARMQLARSAAVQMSLIYYVRRTRMRKNHPTCHRDSRTCLSNVARPCRHRITASTTEGYRASTGRDDEAMQDYYQDTGTQNNGLTKRYNGSGAVQTAAKQGSAFQGLDTSLPVSDEAYPERIPFHQRLAVAAQDGNVDEAEVIVLEMESRGLTPGPRAYHALVYAYVKANDPEGGLDAIRRTHAAGLQPIAESYVVLIYGFVSINNVEVAKAVFASMQRAPVDARLGWYMLCTALFNFGHGEDAYAYIQRGKREEYYPDLDLYELVLRYLCNFKPDPTEQDPWATDLEADRLATSTGYDPIMEAEHIFFTEMPSLGLVPETRHANWLLLAEALYVSVMSAMTPLATMAQGKWGSSCRPNTDTYNCILRGCVHQVDVRKDPSGYELLPTLLGDMIAAGLRPNKATHALFCEAYLLESLGEEAMSSWRDMLKLARAGEETAMVPNEVVLRLLHCLAGTCRPLLMLEVLRPMWRDGRVAPQDLLDPVPSSGGRSVITCWLPAFLLARRARQRTWGEEDMEPGPAYMLDGVLISSDGSVLDVDGFPVPITRMTTELLQIEAKARNLDVVGNPKRNLLMKAIKEARSRAEKSLATEARRRGVEKLRKAGEQAAVRGQRRETAKREANRVTWQVEVWEEGQLVKEYVETEEREVRDDLDEPDDDFDDDEGTIEQRQQVPEPKDLDMWDFTGEEDQRSIEQSSGQAEEWWPPDESGSRMALEMLELLEDMGGEATAGDLAELALAAEEELYVDGALAVAERLLAEVDSRDQLPEPLHYYQQTLHRCATTCILGGQHEDAQELLEAADEVGLPFDDALHRAWQAAVICTLEAAVEADAEPVDVEAKSVEVEPEPVDFKTHVQVETEPVE